MSWPKIFVLCLITLLLSCQESETKKPSWLEEGEEFAGGATTVFDESVNAFGNAAPNLTGDKDLLFVTGNSYFKRNWITAPASTEDIDGLGPHYNARSCSSCHDKDGRGQPPLTSSESPVSLLFRLSVPSIEWQPLPDPNYGTQLQSISILGITPEGNASVSYHESSGTYPDGTAYSLRVPHYSFNLNYGDFAEGIMISPRIAPHMIGLGLLEAINDEQLLAMADPDDSNKDGISGRVNYVWDVQTEQPSIGRFGWKANQPNVRQQVAGAFNGDIGITSSLFPEQPCSDNQEDCKGAVAGGTPELTADVLDRVVLYSATLAVPRRRNWKDQEVLRGKELFNTMNCVGCHVATITTGTQGDFPEFMNQKIHPYTDLLLHDMGEGLADNRPDYDATGNEWRTPPLWGIGLIPTVNGHSYLLHDGRARNIEEAILWHDGEAKSSQQAFKELKKSDREAVIKFIESL